jgi:predicted small integral membrane protein
MGLIKWYNSMAKKLKWHDISLIKLSSALFALFLADIWPGLLALNWWWYLILSLVVAIPVWKKVFS